MSFNTTSHFPGSNGKENITGQPSLGLQIKRLEYACLCMKIWRSHLYLFQEGNAVGRVNYLVRWPPHRKSDSLQYLWGDGRNSYPLNETICFPQSPSFGVPHTHSPMSALLSLVIYIYIWSSNNTIFLIHIFSESLDIFFLCKHAFTHILSSLTSYRKFHLTLVPGNCGLPLLSMLASKQHGPLFSTSLLLGAARIYSLPVLFFLGHTNKTVLEFPSEPVSKFFCSQD